MPAVAELVKNAAPKNPTRTGTFHFDEGPCACTPRATNLRMLTRVGDAVLIRESEDRVPCLMHFGKEKQDRRARREQSQRKALIKKYGRKERR